MTFIPHRISSDLEKSNSNLPDHSTPAGGFSVHDQAHNAMSKPQMDAWGCSGVQPFNHTAPAGGIFAGVQLNTSKFQEVVDSNDADIDGEIEGRRLFNDIKMKSLGSGQVSEREIISRLGSLSDAGVSAFVASMAHPSENTVDTECYGSKQAARLKADTPTTFHKFRKLPKEIRIMIWTLALPELFEVVPNFQKNPLKCFITGGPRESIFAICNNYQKIFYMSPIYLTHVDRDTKKDIEPTYIRPEHDILYLNTEALYELDIPAFISRHENQVIQNIALPVVLVEKVRWCGTKLGREIGTRSWVGDLVRGLKKLKTLYVVEGHTLHVESEVTSWSPSGRFATWDISLQSCKDPIDTEDWSPPPISYSPPAKPWKSAYAVDVTEWFKDEVSREKSGQYNIIFEGEWSEPEVVCKELKRQRVHQYASKDA